MMTATAYFWVTFIVFALPIVGLVLYAEYLLWAIKRDIKKRRESYNGIH